MAWYAYCIGDKQAFPELARHRKPIPLESVLESVEIRSSFTPPVI
jgi:hypothetical protein